MKDIVLRVEGMHCGGCENRIINALSEIEGVEKVLASFKDGVVFVTASEALERSILEETIEDIGFEIVKED